MKFSILVVDDEAGQRQFINGSLAKDYEVVTAANGSEASQLLSHRSFSLVITDERMPGMGGIELIRWMREKSPETPVIVLTAYGSIETAVEAIKLGAEEYLIKPLKSPEELRMVVGKVLRSRAMRDRSILHQQETEAALPLDVVAESESIKRIFQLAGQVAPQPTTVLLTGESGTGKEVVARFIHSRSPRREHAFVAINCSAIPETLLESELFGHEKGSFTGANARYLGKFEQAHGGTLFLDEIGDMPLGMQAKLLRALEEGEIERIGAERLIPADVRVLTATHRNIENLVQKGQFRQDLYHRIYVFPLMLPPLRERLEDIPILVKHFSNQIALQNSWKLKSFTPEATEELKSYSWPGNIRELRNIVERLLLLADAEVDRKTVQAGLPFSSGGIPSAVPGGGSLAERVEAFEREVVQMELRRHDYRMSETAKALALERSHLYKKCQHLGIDLHAHRTERQETIDD